MSHETERAIAQSQMSCEKPTLPNQPKRTSEGSAALILQLPRELRDLIYEYIIEDPSRPEKDDVMVYPKPEPLPDYLVGAQILGESLYQQLSALHIQCKRFRVFNTKAAELLTDWLRQIRGGFEHVRHLYLHDFQPAYPPSGYREILQRCTNLQTLTLHGEPSRLLFVSFASVFQREKDPHIEIVPLRPEYLEMFRNLRKLNRLEWVNWRGYYDHEEIVSRGQVQARQFKLLLGGETEVVWTQVLAHKSTEIKEVIHEKHATAWAHQMLESEDFGDQIFRKA